MQKLKSQAPKGFLVTLHSLYFTVWTHALIIFVQYFIQGICALSIFIPYLFSSYSVKLVAVKTVYISHGIFYLLFSRSSFLKAGFPSEWSKMQFYAQEPKEKRKLNAPWERAISLFGCTNLFVDLCQEEELFRIESVITGTETGLVQLQLCTS